jgi:predicted dehydrogenase
MTIKAGIIGCGNIAWKWDKPDSRHYNTHAKAYYNHPDVELKACCDIKFENAKGLTKAYPGVVPYRNYRTMLDKENLDIVSVCIPTPMHYEILKYILRETDVRYILAEKPLTSSIDQTREILNLAKKKKVYIAINYIRRFDKSIGKFKDLIDSSDFGRFLFGAFGYYGRFKNNGIHFLDFLNYIGIDYKFSGFTSIKRRFKDDFSAAFMLKDKNNNPIYFNCIEKEKFSFLEVDLFYERARIRLDDYSNVYIYKVGRAKSFSDFEELKLKKRLPSTILSVMRYSVDEIVKSFKKGAISYEQLESELKLMEFVSEMDNALKEIGKKN